MRSSRSRRKAHLSWAACGLVLLAGGTWRGRAAGEKPAAGVSETVEIRFGVVEPPVVAQGDITVRAPTSNQQPEEQPLECSGMAWADGQLIISSDRHGHILFTCPIDLEQMTIGRPEPRVVIRNEQELLDDAESLTVRPRGGGAADVYAMCSLSNDRSERSLPQRRHFLRLTVDRLAAGRPVVLNAGGIRQTLSGHLTAIGVRPYRTYYGDFPGPEKNTYRWGNVEGMTFTPDGSLLLCGMRNPLFGGAAMLFVVRGADGAFEANDPGRLAVTDLFALDLGRRGVSDLCWDPLTKGYLIAAARSNGPRLDKDQPFPPNTLDSALFWWSGRKRDRPLLFARAPDMTLEAICRLGGSRFIAVGSDEGDVSEGRGQRQSVLTILEFTGIGAGP